MITKAAGAPALLVRGWSHESWVHGYFPTDLPRDWRFSYATNDLSALVIPASDWSALTKEELGYSLQLSESAVQTWINDVPDGFEIYLELEHPDIAQTLSNPGIADLTATLGKNFAGFLERPNALREAMAAGGETWAVESSICDSGDPHLQRESLGAVWVGGTAFSTCPDLKALADFFRHRLRGPLESRPGFIVITEPEVTPTVLPELETLVELLCESLSP